MPRSPSRNDWELYGQLGFLVIVALGGLVTWRWEGIGAALMTLGGVGLGALAAVEHHPYRALLVALAFYLPALLFWLVWQRSKPLLEVAALAAALMLALAVGGWGANRVYATYFGPVQPTSKTAALPVAEVEWIWSGGTTSEAVTVKAKLARDFRAVRLAVSTSAEMESPIFVPPAVDPVTTDAVAAFQVVGLTPDTTYWYAVEADGKLDLSRQGRLRTFPTGAASFTVALGSCSDTGSNGAVFDAIRATDPLLFIADGDLFYEDIRANDPALFQAGFDRTLTAPAQAALYRSAPIAYVWDDHDFGPNDADSTSPSRPAAQATYRDLVPHYPLSGEPGDAVGPIYQAFTIGRVRFIMTDNRSAMSPVTAPDDATKTMLGAEQKAWFKQELLAARDRYPVIVWVNPQPWIVTAGPNAYGWGAYATERRELADFIATNQINGLVMLSGDAHMLAIDDGTNSDYSSVGGAAIPVFHAAALDRHGSLKGGPYSEGTHLGGGQFGLMTVEDTGGETIGIIWSGRNYKNQEIMTYRFEIPVVGTEPVAGT